MNQSSRWNGLQYQGLRMSAPLAVASLIGVAGLVVTCLAVLGARELTDGEARARIEGHAQRLDKEITERITRAEYGLRGAMAAYAATRVMDRGIFRGYVEARDLDREFPGVRGLGFIEQVPRARLPEFQHRERMDNDPNFTVRTRGDADLYVIKYIEPLQRNRPALGYDVGSEPVRREAVERAVATGQMTMTGVITLVQDERRGPGFLIFVPAYRWDVRTPQERPAALEGLFYAPIVASEVLGRMGTFVDHEVSFQLFDQGSATPYYDTRSSRDKSVTPAFTLERTLSIGGRQHLLRVTSNELLVGGLRGQVPTLAGAAGAIMTLLLTWAAWLLASGRARALAQAQAMTADRRRLATVVEHSSNAVFGLDLRLNVLWINRGFTRTTGWEPDECIGRPISQVLRSGDAGGDPWAQLHAAGALSQGMRIDASTFHRDGHALWLDIEVQPATDDTGRQVGWIEIGTDVTQLRSARDMALNASQAKSRFLSSVSHELRTPMNAVMGMLALLERTGLNLRQADYAVKARTAAQSLLQLLNDVLDLAKVEAGRMSLTEQAFSFDRLLRELSVILAVQARLKPIELVYALDPALPALLLGDELRLRQILTNLCGNAIKFTETGEVSVSITVLESRGSSVLLRVEVRDTGIGMSPQECARLFDEFVQANAHTAARFGGTGLGLSICQRLAGLMGSRIHVTSQVGHGSCFSMELCLPVAEPAAAAGPAAAGSVILIEPHPLSRAAIVTQLGQLGWQVDLADGWAQALDLIEGDRGPSWQAVLGPAFPQDEAFAARRQKCFAQLQNLRVVLLAGHAGATLAEAGGDHALPEEGALTKPVTPSMLAERLEPRCADADTSAGAEPKTLQLAGLRLLVAEDNLINQEIAKALLEAEGACVTLVDDGEQAVAQVRERGHELDLVLMDIQMPVMDGIAATSAIRALPHGGRIPIVAMTANAYDADRQACLDAGMNAHVGKPFDLRHLVSVLRSHVKSV